jgi:DNA-binding CsgD family transcriptional regulator
MRSARSGSRRSLPKGKRSRWKQQSSLRSTLWMLRWWARVIEELIGRERECASILDFLDRARTGPYALVLEGEAGIGKSTLWWAGLRAARRRGQRILTCRPTGSEAQFSFAALGDLLEGVTDVALSRLPSPQRRGLEIALLLEDAKGARPDRRAVAVALLGALRTLAEDGPVLVAVDDTPWLDRPSATALAFAARRLGEQPIGFLLARRADGTDELPLGLEQALPEERLRRIVLGPLSRMALHELLRTRLDTAFPLPILRKIEQTSGGNPYFALELGRALRRSKAEPAPGEALPVPETLSALVRERLAQLPARTREALLAASALSHPTLAHVEAALSRRTGASAALAKAIEADVIEVELDRIRFTHPLLASTLYSETSPARRRGLHRRLADVVADPEETARHLARAAAGPDSAVASALDTAAAAARARGAPETAAQHAQQARLLTPPDQASEHRRRSMEAAGYHFEAGDTAGARRLMEEVVSASARGRERAAALIRLGEIHLFEDLRHAVRLFEEALTEAGADLPLRAEVEQGLAMALFMRFEDLPTAAVHARAAVALAEDLDDPAALAHALVTQSVIHGHMGERVPPELIDRALALEPSTRHLRVIRYPSWVLNQLLILADRFDAARAALMAHYQLADERGDDNSLPYIFLSLSRLELLADNWAEASRWADEGYDVAVQTGEGPQLALLLAVRALLEARLGAVDSARAVADQTIALAERTGASSAKITGTWALGFLELSLGNPVTAHSYLGSLVEAARAAGIREPGALRFVPDEIEALIALGRLAEAECLIEWFEMRGRALERASALAACGRCRGLLLAARGDLAGAHASLEDALGQRKRVSQPFGRARSLFVLGTIQRRQKKRRVARAALEEAVAIFDRLGARLWAEKARAELARIGGRAPSRLELTPTEERVAALVAAGYTNREAAAALFVSVKTVEWNLSKIYAKLGIHSRRELSLRLGR